jgi:hypothetical protein
VVSGQLETRVDTVRANGIERTLQSFMAVVPNDKITYLAVVTDVADQQTALNVAINAGTQAAGPPIRNPAAPCAGV